MLVLHGLASFEKRILSIKAGEVGNYDPGKFNFIIKLEYELSAWLALVLRQEEQTPGRYSVGLGENEDIIVEMWRRNSDFASGPEGFAKWFFEKYGRLICRQSEVPYVTPPFGSTFAFIDLGNKLGILVKIII